MSQRTIWKFPLQVVDSQVIAMPVIRELLTVQIQTGRPCLWAMVNPNATTNEVQIVCFGTGHLGPLLRDRYIATVQLSEFVWHFYERTEE